MDATRSHLSHLPTTPKPVRKHRVDTKNISKSHTEYLNNDSEIVIVPNYTLNKSTFISR